MTHSRTQHFRLMAQRAPQRQQSPRHSQQWSQDLLRKSAQRHPSMLMGWSVTYICKAIPLVEISQDVNCNTDEDYDGEVKGGNDGERKYSRGGR
jgi:hypothetical protein